MLCWKYSTTVYVSSELYTFYWKNFRRMPWNPGLGAKYKVWLRQVYECEKKLRLLSVLRFKLQDKEVDISTFDTDWCNFMMIVTIYVNTVSVTLTTNDCCSRLHTYDYI